MEQSEAPIDLSPFYDGERQTPTGEKLELINPATGMVEREFFAASNLDVEMAVSSARRAFDVGPWQNMPPMARRQLLFAFAETIESESERLARADSTDMGKPISAARQEIAVASGFIRYYAEAIDKFYPGQTAPTPVDVVETQTYRPRGVVAAITPWNFPIVNAALKLGPALAAGNTIVLKPSEIAPSSTMHLATLAHEAGIPAGVVNIVPGAAQTGEAMVADRRVDMLTFTGSTATGQAIMRTSGEHGLKPMLLECGGKCPEIVCADMGNADLGGIAASIARSAFDNQGQVCVARSRLLVHESLLDQVLEPLVSAAKTFVPGPPHEEDTVAGPMASRAQYEKVLTAIEAGIEAGAKLIMDGRAIACPDEGFYLGPSVFTEVPDGCGLVQDEIFGPVLAVQTFRTPEEAITLANATSYGLAATIWTRDSHMAHHMSRSVRSGRTRVIGSPVNTMGALFAHCFEPCGQSGFGIDGGLRGMASYMRLQSTEYIFGSP